MEKWWEHGGKVMGTKWKTMEKWWENDGRTVVDDRMGISWGYTWDMIWYDMMKLYERQLGNPDDNNPNSYGPMDPIAFWGSIWGMTSQKVMGTKWKTMEKWWENDGRTVVDDRMGISWGYTWDMIWYDMMKLYERQLGNPDDNNPNSYGPVDPSIFLGSVWGMIWGVKYLLRQCLDP